MAKAPLVLVGRRKAAERAAARLGYRAIVVTEAPRPEQATTAFGGAPSAVEERLLAEGIDVPAAIVAVAEGAVPSAARARAARGMRGLSPTVAARCHDKLTMKTAARDAGVPCAPWRAVDDDTDVAGLVGELGLPLLLKVPVSSGGRGVVVARTRDEVLGHLRPGLLAEGFVRGVEMSVETLLVDGRAILRNHTRYLEPRWANVVPAVLPPDVAEPVDALVDQVHAALGIDHGITHTELFLTADGPVFSEIAARPPGGHIMELISLAWGIDAWETLLRVELGEVPALPARPSRFAGMFLLHPGAGVVDEVVGLEEVAAMPGVVRAKVRAKPGDLITPRVGSGEATGEVIVVADDEATCKDTLRRARARMRIRMR